MKSNEYIITIIILVNIIIKLSGFMIHYFKDPIDHIPLPEKFTFPFYYDPHPLSILAAKELQAYIENQTDFEHNFGLEKNHTHIYNIIYIYVCMYSIILLLQ
jgi:hypothetical protein